MNLTNHRISFRITSVLAFLPCVLAAACSSGLATPEISQPQTGSDGSQAASSGGDTSSTSSGGDQQPSREVLFGPSIKKVVIEIDYATGKAPYTGQQVLFGDVWGVFQANAARLFQDANKEITVPTDVAQMEELKDVSGADFTTAQILAIADAHRDMLSTADTATFYFVWLPGNYNDGKEVRKDVLGVSLGDTGVIAMFKDVIAAQGSLGALDPVPKYVEQATLVHEFGHAVGLVDNGIPTTSAHHDDAHAAHCTNTNCVMYYAVDGTSGAVSYAQKAVTTSSSILFADDCLADVDAMIKSANGK